MHQIKSFFIRLLIIGCFNAFSLVVFAQQKEAEKMVEQMCDEIIRVMNDEEFEETDWGMRSIDFGRKYGKKDDFYPDQYLQHLISQDCPMYEKFSRQYDTHLKRKPEQRKLYFVTKKLILALETEIDLEKTKLLFSEKAKSEDWSQAVLVSIAKLQTIKRTTWVSNVLVFENGYTFRIRFVDFITNEAQFQIDVHFNDVSDELIDAFSYKNGGLLRKEEEARKEFNKKVESGEFKVPPPPPGF